MFWNRGKQGSVNNESANATGVIEEKPYTEKESATQQLDAIMAALKDNFEFLQGIKETVQSRLEYDAAKETAFDKLCEEMKYQKETLDMIAASATASATDGKTGAEKESAPQQEDGSLAVLRENSSLLQEIKETLQNRFEYDAVKEKAFDKLYDEMKRQREASDTVDRAIKPLLSDLVLLYDNMKGFETELTEGQLAAAGDVVRRFKFLFDDLVEILYRQEVTLSEPDESGKFNSKVHKAVKTESTEIKEDDFKIVATLRNGFVWRDRVLRPQEVVIKRYVEKKQPEVQAH